ncbi:MAG: thioredoxin domain-containing protein [Propionibacteriaceae bacterium]|jgi:protein-disulfide isomerase|nr:thioredoxin domain-containing protein [Propionibacteriaceae bacterium]
MAKVKRSQVAAKSNEAKAVSRDLSDSHEPETETAESSTSGTPTPPSDSSGGGSETLTTAVQVYPNAPRDPRDSTIRTLSLTLVIVGAIALGLLIALLVVVMRGLPAGGTQPPAVETTSASSGSETTAAAPALTYFQNYVAVNPDKVEDGAIIVEIHTDYQCPWCERLEDIYGEALHSLSESGDIDLRIHLRTIIGDQLIKNDSSARASVGALCANEVGRFWDYHSAIFANQPQEGVGYTDAQLRDTFASQAGITGASLAQFQTCYDAKATMAAVTEMEQEGVAAEVKGTPTIFVNGQQVNFNLQSDVAHGSPVQKITAESLLSSLKSLG